VRPRSRGARGGGDPLPDDDALRVFLALALWSGGRERAAFDLLGKVAVDSADLGGYRRAASFYLDHIE